MQKTYTCKCGHWMWSREKPAWADGHGYWQWNGVTCGICEEKLPANPEKKSAPKDEAQMPIPQHYIAVRIAGKRYWAYGAKTTGDASTGVTIELTNLDAVEPEPDPPKCSEATVMLQSYTGEELRFTRITSLGVRGRTGKGQYQTGVEGDWYDGEGKHSGGYILVHLSLMGIAVAARAAWGEHWTCEGAVSEVVEPTVTLHGDESAAKDVYEFSSIRRIEVKGNCTWVWGDANFRWPESTDAAIRESPAEITAAAREAWGPRWTCEDAVPEVEDATVTLHYPVQGNIAHDVVFQSISEINPDTLGIDGTCLAVGHAVGGSHHCRAYITESPAEITEKARAAWGQYWSCPGCVGPVVAFYGMESAQWFEFASITHINFYAVEGTKPDGSPSTVYGLEEDEAAIRAASEVAGVPCVGEEEPEHYHAGPFVGYDPAAKDGAGAFVRLTAERADDGGFRVIGIENVPVREENDLRERVRATVWGNEKWKLKQQRDKARADVAELCEQRDAAYRKRDDKHGEMIEAQNELAAVEAERDRLQAQLAEADPLSPEPEYPEAWKAKPQSFEAYGCSIELSEGHGWGYFVTSTDDIYGQPSTQGDSGMSKQEAIAAADAQAKAWESHQ